MIQTKQYRFGRVIFIILLVFLLVVFLFPIYWMVITSLKTRIQTFEIPPVWFFKPTFENYKSLLTAVDVSRSYMNSIIIAVSGIVLTMALGSMAAYGLTRFKFRGKNDLNFWILTTRMFPPVAIIIPVYMLFRDFHILDTHIALILMYVVFNLGIAIWMLEGFFSEIPIELEESAFLDGCSRFKVLWSIIYPLGKSGIVATSIFCLIFTWNEYLYAVILTGRNARTMPVTVAGAITDRGVMWGELTAVAVLVAIPILVFAALIQRHLIRGLTFGAVKQ